MRRPFLWIGKINDLYQSIGFLNHLVYIWFSRTSASDSSTAMFSIFVNFPIHHYSLWFIRLPVLWCFRGFCVSYVASEEMVMRASNRANEVGDITVFKVHVPRSPAWKWSTKCRNSTVFFYCSLRPWTFHRDDNCVSGGRGSYGWAHKSWALEIPKMKTNRKITTPEGGQMRFEMICTQVKNIGRSINESRLENRNISERRESVLITKGQLYEIGWQAFSNNAWHIMWNK